MERIIALIGGIIGWCTIPVGVAVGLWFFKYVQSPPFFRYPLLRYVYAAVIVVVTALSVFISTLPKWVNCLIITYIILIPVCLSYPFLREGEGPTEKKESIIEMLIESIDLYLSIGVSITTLLAMVVAIVTAQTLIAHTAYKTTVFFLGTGTGLFVGASIALLTGHPLLRFVYAAVILFVIVLSVFTSILPEWVNDFFLFLFIMGVIVSIVGISHNSED
jgi:membrane protein